MGHRRELSNKKNLVNNQNEFFKVRIDELQQDIGLNVCIIKKIFVKQEALVRKIISVKKDVEGLKNWIITFLILHVITAFLLGWFIGRVLEISGL